MMAKAGYVSVKYRMSLTDAVAYFNKYVGDWGSESTVYKFEAFKDGKMVKELTIAPMTKRHLSVTVDHNELVEDTSYDVAAVRILDKDENGNVLPFSNDPLCLSTIGPIEIIGPSIISLQGGMSGTYVRTTGKKGDAKLIITPQQGESKIVEFKIK
jgi:beta-galactosidase